MGLNGCSRCYVSGLRWMRRNRHFLDNSRWEQLRISRASSHNQISDLTAASFLIIAFTVMDVVLSNAPSIAPIDKVSYLHAATTCFGTMHTSLGF